MVVAHVVLSCLHMNAVCILNSCACMCSYACKHKLQHKSVCVPINSATYATSSSIGHAMHAQMQGQCTCEHSTCMAHVRGRCMHMHAAEAFENSKANVFAYSRSLGVDGVPPLDSLGQRVSKHHEWHSSGHVRQERALRHALRIPRKQSSRHHGSLAIK